jgi:hypothetical protein
MALPDDLNRFAQFDVAYLTLGIGRLGVEVQTSSTIVFRGRLHQALSGNWVFNTSTGQNGVAGIILGTPGGNWTSVETPAGGLQITITNALVNLAGLPGGGGGVAETITLMSVIPADLDT